MSLTDGQRAALLIRAAVEAIVGECFIAPAASLGFGLGSTGEEVSAALPGLLALADRLEARDAAPPEPARPPVFKRGDRVRLVKNFDRMLAQDTVVVADTGRERGVPVAWCNGWPVSEHDIEPLDGHTRGWWVPARLLVHL